jgi:hypothetical protein
VRRSGQAGTGYRQYPDEYLYETLGLYALRRYAVPTCRARRLDDAGESRMGNVAPVDMWRSAPKVAASTGWRLLNAT